MRVKWVEKRRKRVEIRNIVAVRLMDLADGSPQSSDSNTLNEYL